MHIRPDNGRIYIDESELRQLKPFEVYGPTVEVELRLDIYRPLQAEDFLNIARSLQRDPSNITVVFTEGGEQGMYKPFVPLNMRKILDTLQRTRDNVIQPDPDKSDWGLPGSLQPPKVEKKKYDTSGIKSTRKNPWRQ